jgi:hypothetical protein
MRTARHASRRAHILWTSLTGSSSCSKISTAAFEASENPRVFQSALLDSVVGGRPENQLFGVSAATRTKVGESAASIALRAPGYRSR